MDQPAITLGRLDKADAAARPNLAETASAEGCEAEPIMERVIGSVAQKPLVLTVIPGAGFTFETGCMLKNCDLFDVVYLRTQYGGEPGAGMLPHGRWFPVRPFATLTRPSRLEDVRAFIDAFLATLRVLRSSRVGLVVAVGTPHAVPMLLAARLLKVRTVFVESITRTDRLSLVGRVVLHLRLSSRLFVQWPALQALHPRTELGTIL